MTACKDCGEPIFARGDKYALEERKEARPHDGGERRKVTTPPPPSPPPELQPPPRRDHPLNRRVVGARKP